MIRDKWIVGLRNKCRVLADECDSAAAINGSRLTSDERECLQEKLLNIVSFVDRKLS